MVLIVVLLHISRRVWTKLIVDCNFAVWFSVCRISQFRLNSDTIWQAPAEPITNTDELQLGGVYIRLLNKNPMWTLRRPREFITCLFDRIIDLTGVENIEDTKQMDELTVLAETGCNLLTSQTNLAKMSKLNIILKYLWSFFIRI